MSSCLPFKYSRIGLITGHMYFLGAIIAYKYNYPNMVIMSSTIYGTTMVHWYNIKSSGIAKTVDMIAVVTGILFVSFHESYKFPGNGHQIWNSSIIISAVSYLFNSTILNCQSEPLLVSKKLSQEHPQELSQKEEEPYNYFSLQPIPPNSPNRERMYFYTTVIHTFFLHVLPITVGMYCVINPIEKCETIYIFL